MLKKEHNEIRSEKSIRVDLPFHPVGPGNSDMECAFKMCFISPLQQGALADEVLIINQECISLLLLNIDGIFFILSLGSRLDLLFLRSVLCISSVSGFATPVPTLMILSPVVFLWGQDRAVALILGGANSFLPSFLLPFLPLHPPLLLLKLPFLPYFLPTFLPSPPQTSSEC